MKGVPIGFLVCLLLVIGGTGLYLMRKGALPKEMSATPSPVPTQTLVGNDADEHGCIGSAGYSWCEAKQKCLRVWEETCDNAPSPSVDETTIITGAMKAAIIAKRGASASELNYTVSKIEGDYAQGGASGQGGGGMWFAAKVGNEWKLVWDGNGIILCSDLTAYPDFPTTMIPECFNDKKQELEKR